MQKKGELDWLAMYIYVEKGKAEQLIIHYIRPLIKELKKQRVIKGFFFIRYFEDGYHIRLRIQGEHEKLNGIVLEKMVNHVNQVSKLHTDLIKGYKLCLYEPEIERYGGLKAIKFAEKHFQHSSEVAIEAIYSSKHVWDYAHSLSAAFSLHLVFLNAVSFTLEEKQALLLNINTNWFNHAINFYKLNKASEMPDDLVRNNINKAFHESFEKQKNILFEIARNITGGSTKSMVKWKKQVELLDKNLHDLYNKTTMNTGLSENNANAKVSLIYESVIHMTNNRMGISNLDEAFMGYILYRVLTNLYSDHINS